MTEVSLSSRLAPGDTRAVVVTQAESLVFIGRLRALGYGRREKAGDQDEEWKAGIAILRGAKAPLRMA